ncbi:MAG: hypothetical protein M1818_000222 [Claussenomyces sp. TS43310]|nr:MAG: hypothetical protein M1818_000222 [Claussenomyces sp. TS43310]
MLSDDSSELSSAPSDLESDIELPKKEGILRFFSKASGKASVPKVEDSPPPPDREPSPPHEYVLADNPDIAFIVMFRSRFTEAFPKSLANFGPQELERGVVDTAPGEYVEHLLCALLGLLLNRKQDVKYVAVPASESGHYNRALEEAVQTHKSQWARDWESKNPLSGGATFTSMSPAQRLTLLRTLILWALSSSDVVKGMIAASYKQTRQEDDLNQPLSVQPWGSDAYKRKYYLIEGLDDTNFRIYKESSGINRTWWSVAGDIEELKALADRLSKDDGGQKARVLAGKMRNAIPRFEATEEKRKRREYRQIRKQQFKRPEPNFSSYEGRTRGKRMKYTYSDDDDDEVYSDATSRRSTKNTGTNTPAETGPTVTSSGRQVKSRQGGAYGESMLSGMSSKAVAVGGYDGVGGEPTEEDDTSVGNRPRRAAALNDAQGGCHIEGYNSVDAMDDEEDASEQDYGDDEDDEHVDVESDEDDQDDFSDDDAVDDGMDLDLDNLQEQKSLVVKLPVKTPTPEKQSSIKLNLSPQWRPADDPGPDRDYEGSSTVSTSLALTPSGTTDQAVPGSVSLPSAPDAEVNGVSKELALSQPHNVRPASPLSPSLTYRESPGKIQNFPHSINVGEGGSQ